jgi:hypothetical protein
MPGWKRPWAIHCLTRNGGSDSRGRTALYLKSIQFNRAAILRLNESSDNTSGRPFAMDYLSLIDCTHDEEAS